MTVSPSQIALNWDELLRREVEARDAAHESVGRPDEGEQLRRWWETVDGVLTAYSESVARETPVHPPPIGVIEVMRGFAGYLAVGQIPEPIEKAASPGRRRPGPQERRDIGLAVAYWSACQAEGLTHNGITIRIDDPDPVERLHLWYGVGKRTIYDWLKKYLPAFLGVNDVNARIVISLTQQAAERYRLGGRSAAAITSRARKRSR